ncbi:MAG: hypothetical protein HY033_00320 [Ignavibacteriae bacterium]|nr:hypothetical protein [Ignavibacteria bacterium]MBI3363332.1 hypothetical protein [Ignavibacteriota bacterium]
MATKQPRPVPQDTIRDDAASLVALKEMTGYNPNNPDVKVDAIQALADARIAARAQEKLASDAWNAKRDAADAADRVFHLAMKQAKKAVSVQFGEDSDEVASMGLKKAGEYKRPERKAKTNAVTKAAA